MLPKVLLAITYYSGKNNERARYLDKFLESIYKNTTNYDNYEIIIFDDLSPFPPQCQEKVIVADKPQIRWHKTRNRVHQYFLYHPEYKYLFAYDEDYEVIAPNWMNHIVGCMENIPEIGVLGAHWARLADGITRQKQHTPTGYIDNGSGFVVHTNKFVTGGCWTIRREAVRLYPDEGDADFVGYDSGKPGADTWYGNWLMANTSYKLCTTFTDLVMHRGQEFMIGKYEHKYNSEEYKTGKRLY